MSEGEDGPWDPNTPLGAGFNHDPEVIKIANTIEFFYLGHVKQAPGMIYRDANGDDIMDIDIRLGNALIEVKTGRGKGTTAQMNRYATVRQMNPDLQNLTLIVYGPDIGGEVAKSLERSGMLVVRDMKTLLQLVRP